jgi:SSS family solute:Na+ symporter
VSSYLALLIAYSAALVAIGLWIARRVRRSADFFVAGRSLNATLLFSTVLAANIGAGTTIGAAGVGYRDGLSGWWWNGAAAIGSIFLALTIGPRIWRLASRHNLYTAGDYLELRYGPTVRGIIAVLIWLGTLSILAGQLIGGAAILTAVAGVPRITGIAISAIAVTSYFVAGGLLSSAWVNVVQLTVKLAAFAVVTPLVIASVGGFHAIVTAPAVPATYGDLLYSSGPRSGWTFLMLLGPAFVVSPGLLQKVYGGRSERTVRIGVGAQALTQAAFGFLPPLLGMAARVAHPDMTDLNLVLPTVLVDRLPASLGGLALAALYSAEVSTCDAILFMLATSLSQDLYKRFVRPQASDRQLLRVARLAAIAGGIGGIVLALKLQTVVDALSIFYSLLGVSLFVPVVGGLYTRRAGTPEAIAAIAAGTSACLTAFFVPHAAVWWLDPAVAGIVAAAAAFLVVFAVRRPR